MPRPPELYQWRAQIAKHFPGLSQPVVMGLALWSLGMRERLRDTYREAEAKAGAHRAQLDLGPCWALWSNWVLEGWSGPQLALALDVTRLGQPFVLLVVGVVYRGVPCRSPGRSCRRASNIRGSRSG